MYSDELESIEKKSSLIFKWKKMHVLSSFGSRSSSLRYRSYFMDVYWRTIDSEIFEHEFFYFKVVQAQFVLPWRETLFMRMSPTLFFSSVSLYERSVRVKEGFQFLLYHSICVPQVTMTGLFVSQIFISTLWLVVSQKYSNTVSFIFWVTFESFWSAKITTRVHAFVKL